MEVLKEFLLASGRRLTLTFSTLWRVRSGGIRRPEDIPREVVAFRSLARAGNLMGVSLWRTALYTLCAYTLGLNALVNALGYGARDHSDGLWWRVDVGTVFGPFAAALNWNLVWGWLVVNVFMWLSLWASRRHARTVKRFRGRPLGHFRRFPATLYNAILIILDRPWRLRSLVGIYTDEEALKIWFPTMLIHLTSLLGSVMFILTLGPLFVYLAILSPDPVPYPLLIKTLWAGVGLAYALYIGPWAVNSMAMNTIQMLFYRGRMRTIRRRVTAIVKRLDHHGRRPPSARIDGGLAFRDTIQELRTLLFEDWLELKQEFADHSHPMGMYGGAIMFIFSVGCLYWTYFWFYMALNLALSLGGMTVSLGMSACVLAVGLPCSLIPAERERMVAVMYRLLAHMSSPSHLPEENTRLRISRAVHRRRILNLIHQDDDDERSRFVVWACSSFPITFHAMFHVVMETAMNYLCFVRAIGVPTTGSNWNYYADP